MGVVGKLVNTMQSKNPTKRFERDRGKMYGYTTAIMFQLFTTTGDKTSMGKLLLLYEYCQRTSQNYSKNWALIVQVRIKK